MLGPSKNARSVVGVGLCLVLVGCHAALPLETRKDVGADGAVSDGAVSDGTTDSLDLESSDQQVVDQLVPDLLVPDLPCHGLTCALGCEYDKMRCQYLQPSNIPDPIRDDFDKERNQLLDIVISQVATIDTKTGEITGVRAQGQGVISGIYWNATAQPTGYPGLSVFMVKSLIIQQGVTVNIKGDKAFVLYAAGDVTIDGKLTAPADKEWAGPGGKGGGRFNFDGGNAAPCLSGGAGQSGLYNQYGSGGGGAGHGDSGGLGGASFNGAAIGGIPGAAVGQGLSPLSGGCGGGAGGGAGSSTPGDGGGGGGAIQITANGTISVAGVISVPGGGGYGAPAKHGGGGGGGSGGAILLEALAVAVSGMLAANGGGGGSGGAPLGFSPNNGAGGTDDTSAALGGAETHATFQNPGGNGGALAPTKGQPGSGAGYSAGGGGGAVGRIHCNSPTINVPANHSSPVLTQSLTVTGW